MFPRQNFKNPYNTVEKSVHIKRSLEFQLQIVYYKKIRTFVGFCCFFQKNAYKAAKIRTCGNTGHTGLC